MEPDKDDVISTDQDILNQIGEGGDEQVTDEGTGGKDQGTAKDINQDALATSDKQGANGSDDKDKKVQAGSPQDIVDAQGNVIAKGGIERRHYETAQREPMYKSVAKESYTPLACNKKDGRLLGRDFWGR